MKFVDQVRIHVKGGDGGHGAVAFRREKYVERGGPNGGDGGNGGSVIFVADPQLTTLLDYRYQQHHHARNGEHGMGNDCNGRASDDMVLRVPVGTLIRDEASGELLADLSQPEERYVAAKGGRGGLGNMNFATSTRQTPRFAQDGTPGEERMLQLELKLLADVGLIGFPNAGKSTLISVISRAKPKIADYPFTTLVPNLGVVPYKDRLSFVVADIPGLIEGASEGHGLGHQFLRHVERCKVLVHIVDLGAYGEGRSPLADYETINRELERYSPALAEKPQLVAANKLDLTHAREALPEFKKALAKRKVKVFEISSATREGIDGLIDAVAQVLFAAEKHELPKSTRALNLEAKAEQAAQVIPLPARAAATPAKKPAARKPAPKLFSGKREAPRKKLVKPSDKRKPVVPPKKKKPSAAKVTKATKRLSAKAKQTAKIGGAGGEEARREGEGRGEGRGSEGLREEEAGSEGLVVAGGGPRYEQAERLGLQPKDLLLDARKERIDEVVGQRTRTVTVVLDRLEDTFNMAAVLRTCESMGLQDVHVVENPEVKFVPNGNVTQGCDKWLDVAIHKSFADCAKVLKDRGYAIWASAIRPGAKSVFELRFDQKIALVFGNERYGVSDEVLALADGVFWIPMRGFSQSLNISAAASACITRAIAWRLEHLGPAGDLTPDEASALTAKFQRKSVKQQKRIFGPEPR